MAIFTYDPHKNFAYSLVATAPSPATSGTSLVVTAGQGTLFPTVPFNATIWPAGQQPTTTNAEIVRVTTVSTDTLTIARAQESSSARTVIVGDQIAATVTAKSLQDIEQATPRLVARQGGTTGDGSWYTTGTSNTDTQTKSPFIQVGSVSLTTDGADSTITFPYAYNQVPIVNGFTMSAGGANVYTSTNTVGTTSFKIRHIGGTSAETHGWISIGQ